MQYINAPVVSYICTVSVCLCVLVFLSIPIGLINDKKQVCARVHTYILREYMFMMECTFTYLCMYVHVKFIWLLYMISLYYTILGSMYEYICVVNYYIEQFTKCHSKKRNSRAPIWQFSVHEVVFHKAYCDGCARSEYNDCLYCRHRQSLHVGH